MSHKGRPLICPVTGRLSATHARQWHIVCSPNDGVAPSPTNAQNILIGRPGILDQEGTDECRSTGQASPPPGAHAERERRTRSQNNDRRRAAARHS